MVSPPFITRLEKVKLIALGRLRAAAENACERAADRVTTTTGKMESEQRLEHQPLPDQVIRTRKNSMK
ncbi:MAG: hypothetical protein IPQ01_08625 [Zoogloea sp.]|nr:hypothetical protein [Zoogloea sp.]